MSWIDLWRMSSSSLKRRKLRTFLTVLGVVIGTASIVVMISLGLGMQQSMYKEVEQNGGVTSIKVTGKEVNESYVHMGDMGESDSELYVTDETLKEMEQMEHIESIYPVISLPIIIAKGNYICNADLEAIPREAMEDLDIPFEADGRIPDESTGGLEMVFGNWMPEMFYDKNTGKGYWETGEFPDIDYGKDNFFVTLDQDAYYKYQENSGLNALQDNSEQSQEQGQTNTPPKKFVTQGVGLVSGGTQSYTPFAYNVYCDQETLKTLLKKEYAGKAYPGQPTKKNGKPYPYFIYSSANVKVDDMENVEAVVNQFKAMGYNASSNAEMLESMKGQFAIIQAVLGGIGAISLLVAAIGIANTMMMSIYERTKEIGVFKVLGCGLKNIKQLFLLEAAGIGVIGGIIGNILSVILSAAINVIARSSGGEMGITENISYIPPWLMLAALGIAVMVGMVSGYFPALRAMRLSPLAAIRNE